MTRLTVAAAAMVAGMTAFAANAQEAPEIFFAPVGKLETKAAERGAPAADARTGRGMVGAMAKSDGRPAAETAPAEVSRKAAKLAAKGKKKGRTTIVLEQGMMSYADPGEAEPASSANRARPVLNAFARGETIVKGGGESSASAKAAGGGKYGTIISRYAATYGVPVALAHAVIRVESNYRANARGSAGEIGLMQIKPATARAMGYSGGAAGLYNPETNIRFGMKYLGMARKLSGGTTCGTILKYNAGHGARRMNPVSAAYCRKVQRHMGA